MRNYIHKTGETLCGTYEGPMSLDEHVDAALESPSTASHTSKYLLEAIELTGTRQVIERGAERQRYRLFNDPASDGKRVALSNTEMLSTFADDLRTIATDRGRVEKIIWFDGPTATGESELERYLINGL